MIDEATLIKSFEQSLTPDEKMACKNYAAFLNLDISHEAGRVRRNLAMMHFIDGFRYIQRSSMFNPYYIKSLLDVAIAEIKAWSGMPENEIRQRFLKKVEEKLNENQTKKKT